MTSGGWEESAELFADLIERPSDEWARLLDERCAGRPSELRTTVERLLSAHEAAEEHFLDSLDAESLQDVISDCATELERVGPYRLVREVGRGGMGTVHLAERADGQFEQRAAVKMLKRGMDSEAILGRFLQERQILSRLAHPNIARLLDGGLAEDGRPFLVMEYVEGEPIADYCARRRLSVEQRLHLFRQVCAAVEYAHRNLVVHRDLKPSNIVVTGDGLPVLLDFGIAKLLSTDDPGASPDTRTAERWMTPEYAAPEQVRGDPPTVSTDVYQLGCVLYELLSGRKPVERDAGGLRELEHDILDREPSPPSAAVAAGHAGPSTIAAAGDQETPAVVAMGRGRSMHARLVRRLEGDLDTIVLKALRKEPDRRYASVAALGADIGRHLEGRPVEARPNTAGYRLRRFVGRHRWGVAAAAAFVALLMVSVVMLAIQQRATARQRDRAEREAQTAQQVSNFMVGLFETANPDEGRVEAITLVNEAASRLDRELADQPEVRASFQEALGRVYNALGRYDRAAALLDASLVTRRDLFGDGAAETASSRHYLAQVAFSRSDYELADSLARVALAGRERTFGHRSAEVMETLSDLAAVHYNMRDYAEAEALAREAAEIGRYVFPSGDTRMGTALNTLANALWAQGEREEARASMRAASEAHRAVYGGEHRALAITLNNLAFMTHASGGSLDEARAAATEALEMQRRLFPDGHPDIAWTMDNLGAIALLRGDTVAAVPLYRDALDLRLRLLDPDHADLMQSHRRLAEVALASGRYEEAEEHYREALRIAQITYGSDHSFTAGLADKLAEVRAAAARG